MVEPLAALIVSLDTLWGPFNKDLGTSERDAPVSTRYSIPVSSNLIVNVAYVGQAAAVGGSLSTRFLTNCKVYGTVGHYARTSYGKSITLRQEGTGISGAAYFLL